MNNIKNNIRESVAINLGDSLDRVLSLISFHLDAHHSGIGQSDFDSVIMLKGQFLTVVQEYNQGKISHAEREHVAQRTRSALLDIINKMPTSVFELPEKVEIKLERNELKKDVLSEKVDTMVAQSTYEYDVFFSFSSKDLDEAKKTSDKLRGYGLRVFFADESLKNRAGQTYTEIINKALEDSTHFIWHCTPESSKSEWVKIEYTTFFHQIHVHNRNTRRFFILKGKGFNDNLVPIIYRNIEYADDSKKIILSLPIENKKTRREEKNTASQNKSNTHTQNDISTSGENKVKIKKYLPWAGLIILLIFLVLGFVKYKNNTKELKNIPTSIQEDTIIGKPQIQSPNPVQIDIQSKVAKEENSTFQFDYPVISVSGGEFMIGQPDPNVGCNTCSKDECSHFVKIESFKMGKYEITQKQWKQIMGSSPMESNFKDIQDNPVESISWEEIQQFILILKSKTGKKYRLPSEAEWEIAARGGKASLNYNKKYSGSDELKKVGWFADNSDMMPHKIGLLQPNDLGIFDMSGNVKEWCQNAYETYSCDPVYRGNKDNCVRGGSFKTAEHFCRVSKRFSRNKSNGFSDVGFRLVLE